MTSSLSPQFAEHLRELRILVVEDQFLLADLAQDMLMDAGAREVVICANARDAMTALNGGGRIEAAMIDLNLGDHTGDTIADTLIAQQVPFIFATGYGTCAALADHLQHVPLLSKPYTAEMLVETLGHAIARARRGI